MKTKYILTAYVGVSILLAGCSEKPFDIQDENLKQKIVQENYEKSKSSISSYGLQLKQGIENREFNEFTGYNKNNNGEIVSKVTDYLSKIERIEQEIYEDEASKEIFDNEEGEIVVQEGNTSDENIKGVTEYFELYDKKTGGIEQYFIYSNRQHTLTLSILWIGDEVYEIY